MDYEKPILYNGKPTLDNGKQKLDKRKPIQDNDIGPWKTDIRQKKNNIGH